MSFMFKEWSEDEIAYSILLDQYKEKEEELNKLLKTIEDLRSFLLDAISETEKVTYSDSSNTDSVGYHNACVDVLEIIGIERPDDSFMIEYDGKCSYE